VSSCDAIGNFTWRKKKYTFEGQKGENKPSEPKNGIWAPKSSFFVFNNEYTNIFENETESVTTT
jgi:hypothetical protein